MSWLSGKLNRLMRTSSLGDARVPARRIGRRKDPSPSNDALDGSDVSGRVARENPTRRVARSESRPRLGYLVKAFPRISETFIINEVLELERQGFDLRIYALSRPSDTRRQRLADQVHSPVTYLPEPLVRVLPAVLTAHAHLAMRFPARYLSAMLRVLTSGDPDLIVRF